MAAAISVLPGPPVRHVSMHTIESRVVADTMQLPVPGVLRESSSKFNLKAYGGFITEMWIGSDEF
eukprot:987164-Pelagomonas_calceolata.AAC.3